VLCRTSDLGFAGQTAAAKVTKNENNDPKLEL